MYTLVICDDEGRTTFVPFLRDSLKIGRHPKNHIQLSDRNISREHAYFFKIDDRFYIEDLNSRNKIFVESQEVGKTPCRVEVEERITIGDYKLSVTTRKITAPLGVQINPAFHKGVGKVTFHSRLIMTRGPQSGLEIDLLEDLYVIGRSEQVNVYVDDPSISRAHARLEKTGSQWIISDLESRNGIHINGEKKDDYALRAGDLVDFGTIQFRFVAESEPYDYKNQNKEQQSYGKKEIPWYGLKKGIFLPLLILIFLLGVLLFLRLSNPLEKLQEIQTTPSKNLPEKIVHDAKILMENEKWEKALILLSEGLEKNFGSREMQKLKQKTSLEIENQSYLESAMLARDSQQWQLSIHALMQISDNSRYYDKRLIFSVGQRLCDDLLYQAEFLLSAEAYEKANIVLSKVYDIPMVSSTCIEKRKELEALLKDSDS